MSARARSGDLVIWRRGRGRRRVPEGFLRELGGRYSDPPNLSYVSEMSGEFLFTVAQWAQPSAAQPSITSPVVQPGEFPMKKILLTAAALAALVAGPALG